MTRPGCAPVGRSLSECTIRSHSPASRASRSAAGEHAGAAEARQRVAGGVAVGGDRDDLDRGAGQGGDAVRDRGGLRHGEGAAAGADADRRRHGAHGRDPAATAGLKPSRTFSQHAGTAHVVPGPQLGHRGALGGRRAVERVRARGRSARSRRRGRRRASARAPRTARARRPVSVASLSRSQSTSMWSLTKPSGTITTARMPRAGSIGDDVVDVGLQPGHARRPAAGLVDELPADGRRRSAPRPVA